MSENVLTPEFRVSYPNVFSARLNDLNNKMEYSVVALFAKNADMSKLKAAAEAACIEKWGADKNKWPKKLVDGKQVSAIRSPFRDQAERAKEMEMGEGQAAKSVLPSGYEAGAFFMNLKSQQRPGVVDQNVQDIIEESQFYAGCYARATVRAYAYGGPGTKFPAGVAFGLGNIQKTRDGDPLSGRTSAADDFAPIAGAAENVATPSTDSVFS